MTANDIRLHIDRDRVHAGDEEYPPFHMIRETRVMRGDVTVGEVVDAIVTRGPDRYSLASVAGRVTWALYGGSGVEKPYGGMPDKAVALAVIDRRPRQYGEARLLVDPDLSLADLADTDGNAAFYFHYLCDADPRETWQRLHAGADS
ncbi:hypothetical protein ACEZDB_31490 [Streptacidiphilus sp. N1-3]|uniref:Uncharacterized protein n=1 Tax=Streptacidiphilus alkalitolerans TaxID=3342712 RepID=A0ABV6XA58_9ACTN